MNESLSTRAVTWTFPAQLVWDSESPLAVVDLNSSGFAGRATVPLVQIFTADEQRGRTSQAYFRSAVGDRLRVTDVKKSRDERAHRVTITQRDERTGLCTSTTIECPRDTATFAFHTTVTNTSTRPITITALSSLTLGFGQSEEDLDEVRLSGARSEWLAEDRWWTHPVRTVLPRLSLGLHGQDGRGHFGVTSHGTWSSGEHLPLGILESTNGTTIGWQIDTSGPWHWELSQARDGGVLTVLGAADLEHQWHVTLGSNESVTSVVASVAVSSSGLEGAVAQLTRYRRWLRDINNSCDDLPVVYNDFMNTLMGQPSTEALLPLISAAAEAGVDCFCIDAGWHADPAIGDWWASVGEWKESPERFTNGLSEVIDAIHERGMRSGLWLEPEAVGVHSFMAQRLPEEAFFHRFGTRVVEHERYHLDFRHPAVRAHLDEVVDTLVARYGISYLKLDYNINPGAGTAEGPHSPAAGLLGHTHALVEWITGLRTRHPQLSIENCSSGAMRADYNLLAVTQLQSTSDQQDFRLYPPIAASAPASIAPEQCGNWAYPAADMSLEEIQFTLVTGLAGRFYLSGFLHRLDDQARAMVSRAVALHASWRSWLRRSEPFWPCGLPGWDDTTVCLGLSDGEKTRIFVWDRTESERQIRIPVPSTTRSATVLSLADSGPQWHAAIDGAVVVIDTVSGFTARVIELA